jgi:hypothetical protein
MSFLLPDAVVRRTALRGATVSSVRAEPRGHGRLARRRTAGAAISFLALLLTAGGCESAPAVGDGPYAKVLGRAIPKVEQATGLTFKETPVLQTRSKDEVREFLLRQLTSERAATTLAGQERVYKLLGLIPPTTDLNALLRRLLEEQIVGYYDPATKVLYVVDDVRSDLVEVTITHELVHALQDQYVNIDSIQKATDDADRQLAAQAILEGQAVYAQLRASMGENALRLGGWQRARTAMRDAQEGMPVFSNAPMVVRESLLFPYTGGADFMHRFGERRRSDNVLDDMPVSSRQLLSDGAYFGTGDTPAGPAERLYPWKVTLPAPSRGRVVYNNVFGEFETRLILFEYIPNELQAGRAAQGVNGDRFALIELPEGDALVWASAWDNAVEAAEFVDQFTNWLRKRYARIGSNDAIDARTRTWYAPADTARGRQARSVIVHVETRGSRPLVVITDAPYLKAAGLIDPARITIDD